MEKMTKKEMVDSLAEKTGETKAKTAIMIDAMFELIGETLIAGKDFPIFDVCTLKVEMAAERKVNPHFAKEKGAYVVPARRTLRCRCSDRLRNLFKEEVEAE